MRRIGIVLTGIVLLAPSLAFAGNFQTGPTLTYSQQDQIKGNLYSAAGTTLVQADAPGDVLVAGGSISITGRVAGDVMALGGTVQVLGPVAGDVRVVGGTVTIGGRVSGDVVVAGGTLQILPGAIINGSLTFRGGKLLLEGTVRGPVDAPTHPAPMRNERAVGMVWAIVAFLTALQMFVLLGATIVAVWFWRARVTELVHHTAAHFWPSAGHGVVYALLTPLAAALLLVSVVGMIPGAFAVLLLFGAVLASKVVAGIFFGAWVSKSVRKSATLRVTWASAILGMIGFQMLDWVPVLGPLVVLAISAAVFGTICDSIRRRIL